MPATLNRILPFLLLGLLGASCSSTQWMEGSWEGTGYTVYNESWNLLLYVKNGEYLVEYPDKTCGGEWKVLAMGNTTAQFQEHITIGGANCAQDAIAVIIKYKDELYVDYYTSSEDLDCPFATGRLSLNE